MLTRSMLALALASCSLPVADELPARKPGLWQITATFADFEAAGLPPVIAEHCIDAETDKLMNIAGGSMKQDSCWKQEVQKVADTFVVVSRCKMGPFAASMHAVISGDLDSAYAVKVTTKQEGEPAPGIPKNGTSTIAAKWLGACRADQKPGDMIVFGRKTNVRDLQKAPAAAPPPRR
jgi:hypothetical protein